MDLSWIDNMGTLFRYAQTWPAGTEDETIYQRCVLSRQIVQWLAYRRGYTILVYSSINRAVSVLQNRITAHESLVGSELEDQPNGQGMVALVQAEFSSWHTKAKKPNLLFHPRDLSSGPKNEYPMMLQNLFSTCLDTSLGLVLGLGGMDGKEANRCLSQGAVYWLQQQGQRMPESMTGKDVLDVYSKALWEHERDLESPRDILLMEQEGSTLIIQGLYSL